MRTVALLTRTELRLLRREPGVLVGLIAFPAVTVLVLAGVFGSTPDPEFGGVVPSEHYVVGYVGVVLASMGLDHPPGHARRAPRARRPAPLPRVRASAPGHWSPATSSSGRSSARSPARSSWSSAALIYGVPAPEDPAAAIAWFLAGLACFIAIGGALGVLMPSSRAAAAIGNLVFVPMFLLGGGGPPREVMTGPMQTLSDVLPLSHLVGGLRQSWLGATDDPHVLLWPVLVAVIAMAVAVRAARRTTR